MLVIVVMLVFMIVVVVMLVVMLVVVVMVMVMVVVVVMFMRVVLTFDGGKVSLGVAFVVFLELFLVAIEDGLFFSQAHEVVLQDGNRVL